MPGPATTIKRSPTGSPIFGLVQVNNMPGPGWGILWDAGTEQWVASPLPDPFPQEVNNFADNTTFELNLGPAADIVLVRVSLSLLVDPNDVETYELDISCNGAGVGFSLLQIASPTPVTTVTITADIVGPNIVARCTGSGPGNNAKLTSRILDVFLR